MEVSHTTDHVSHAVIGAKKVRALEINNDAAMLNLLSTNLYSDGPRAAIREVLCNAWDIHVLTGITDKPVEVTITDNEVTIRDFGCGLHDDQMVPIYGTFGRSTKIHDGEQNGGFGLGSKAPFAVVDHFQVTSWHAGVKTVYVISKSSAEVGGKPGINPIVSTPTTESGLEVKFKFQGSSQLYERLVTEFAKYGEMKVNLNGTLCPTLPFSEAKNGYMVLQSNDLGTSSIYVRYGTVLYPVPRHSEYSNEFDTASNFIRRVTSNNSLGHGHGRLILQAKPHSISVTPSRESLLLVEHTTDTLKELLKNFTNVLHGIKDYCVKLIPASIDEAWRQFGQFRYLLPENQKKLCVLNPGLPVLGQSAHRVFTDIDSLANNYAVVRYPDFPGFARMDTIARLKALIESGHPNRHRMLSYLRYMIKNPDCDYYCLGSDWLIRSVIAPLVVDMQKNDLLTSERLFVYTTAWSQFELAVKYGRRSHDHFRPFLRNILILGHSRADVLDRVQYFPAIEHFFGDARGSLFYHVPRSPRRIEAARKFFEDQGFFVIDLTKYHAWEEAPEVKPKVKKDPSKVVPRPKGIALLSSALTFNDIALSHDAMKKPTAARTETPKTIAVFGVDWTSQSFRHLNIDSIRNLALAFGDQIGVVYSYDQKHRWQDKAENSDLIDWVSEQMVEAFTNNKDVINALALFKIPKNTKTGDDTILEWLQLIASIPELAKHFKVGQQVSSKVQAIINLYLSGNALVHLINGRAQQTLNILYKKIEPAPQTKALIEIIDKSSLLWAVKLQVVKQMLRKHLPDDEVYKKTTKFIIQTLKG